MQYGRDQPSILLAHEIVVTLRDLVPRYVARPPPATEIALESLQLAVGKLRAPPPPRRVQQVEVGEGRPAGNPMIGHPVPHERPVERLSVERNQEIELRQQPRKLLEDGRLLGIAAGQILDEREVAPSIESKADHEQGPPMQSGRLGIDQRGCPNIGIRHRLQVGRQYLLLGHLCRGKEGGAVLLPEALGVRVDSLQSHLANERLAPCRGEHRALREALCEIWTRPASARRRSGQLARLALPSHERGNAAFQLLRNHRGGLTALSLYVTLARVKPTPHSPTRGRLPCFRRRATSSPTEISRGGFGASCSPAPSAFDRRRLARRRRLGAAGT